MSRRSLAVLLAASPGLVASAAWIAVRLGWLSDYVLYLRIRSLGAMLLVTGLALMILCGAGLAAFMMLRQQSDRRVEQARASEATKHRQFLRRLDHEMRNPLTTMQVELGNLETEWAPRTGTCLISSPSPVGNDDAVQRLKAQVVRMAGLVRELRNLGELESHTIEYEPVRVDQLLADLVREYQASQEEGQREITLGVPQIPWPLSEIQGDADLIYLALRNVLDNAVKFSHPGAAIHVRAFEDAGWVIVEIADEGPGIPGDELPYVWEELYRGKLARGLPGSGLGLAIVRAIVERHAGQLTLRSRLDQGTVVTIRLPTRV